ncbi:hypothetical protein ACWDUL_20805 [Nocardia niigatensis]
MTTTTRPVSDNPESRDHYVYRLKILTYPTPDGLAFHEQDPSVWAHVGADSAPDWLPTPEAMMAWRVPERLDKHDNAVGGYYYAPELQLDVTRSRQAAARRLATALELGCTAHIERALIGTTHHGPWAPTPTRRKRTTSDSPA